MRARRRVRADGYNNASSVAGCGVPAWRLSCERGASDLGLHDDYQVAAARGNC